MSNNAIERARLIAEVQESVETAVGNVSRFDLQQLHEGYVTSELAMHIIHELRARAITIELDRPR